ncbi:MAG: hypothetical protein CMH52_00395 [Myxococcales bacterium]|nr:hypothetical protein [Myxococcales bacterium]
MPRFPLLIGCLVGILNCSPGSDSNGQSNWQIAFDEPTLGAYLCAWGADDEVWVVGGQPDSGVLWHKRDGQWTLATIPDGSLLNWTHGADGHQWIVGNTGRILHKAPNTNEWVVEQSGVSAPLWGVWAADSNRVFAVGGNPIDTGEPDPILLERVDGQWQRIDLPETDRVFRALFKVWGTSADNVYAVGAKGTILHFDGRSWRQQNSGTARDIISLWGHRPDQILAVGGRANGIILSYNGEQWTPKVLETEPGLNGVWVSADGHATVVGERGRILSVDLDDLSYERQDNPQTSLLHGVWGHDSGYRIAVGGTLDRNPPWQGSAIEMRHAE